MSPLPTKENQLLNKILKPSPNEENAILKGVVAERRKHRLLQVRTQEKILAEKIRQAVRKRKDTELEALNRKLKETWEEKITAELTQLEREYNERLKSMGEGHKASLEIPERNDLIIKQKAAERALQRYKEAFQKLSDERAAAVNAEKEKIKLRESVMQKEQARASYIASRPTPAPDFVLSTQNKVKSMSSRSKSTDAFSTTRYHMAMAFAEKAESDLEMNAKEAAKELEERLNEANDLLKKDFNERKEKSCLRHEHARQQVLLDQIIRDTLAQVAQPSTSTVADAEVCQTEGEVPMQEQIWDDSVGGSNQLTFENVSIDLSKDRLMVQLEQLEYQDRMRRQQALKNIPAQVFQPPHQRLEDANTKQIVLEEVFEKAHQVTRDTQHAELNLDLHSEDPSLIQPDSMIQHESDLLPSNQERHMEATDEPIPRNEIIPNDAKSGTDEGNLASNQTVAEDSRQPADTSQRMKKLLGRIRKQQDNWAKRNVRIKINTADSDNNDNEVDRIAEQDSKDIDTPRTMEEETTDSLVSADIESARYTNSDSVSGDAVIDQETSPVGMTKIQAGHRNEEEIPTSEHDSLLHPFEKAKIVRSTKKNAKDNKTVSVSDSDSFSSSLESRKHTLENQRHVLEIQKRRLANQILRQELKETKEELEIFEQADNDKVDGDVTWVHLFENDVFGHEEDRELQMELERNRAEKQMSRGGQRSNRERFLVSPESLDQERSLKGQRLDDRPASNLEPVQQLLAKGKRLDQQRSSAKGERLDQHGLPSGQELLKEQLLRSERAELLSFSISRKQELEQQQLIAEKVNSSEDKGHSPTVQAQPTSLYDSSFLSDMDGTRRAHLARKYPNILKGVIQEDPVLVSDNMEGQSRDTITISRPSKAVATSQEANQETISNKPEAGNAQLERIRNYQRQLIEKQKWLKSRQDVIEGRQHAMLDRVGKEQRTSSENDAAGKYVTGEILGAETLGGQGVGGFGWVDNTPYVQMPRVKDENTGVIDAQNMIACKDVGMEVSDDRTKEKIDEKLDQLSSDTRSLANQLSKSMTLDERKRLYETLATAVAEGRQVNLDALQSSLDSTRTVPRLDIQSVSGISISPSNSGEEADTESIDNRLKSDKRLSKNRVKLNREFADKRNPGNQGNIGVDESSRLETGVRKLARISEKPAFSPIIEVEERSFRKQEAILSPLQDGVLKVSSGTSSSLSEQELLTARLSENSVSPPLRRDDKTNGSFLSFRDLQSILSESEFLSLPSARPREDKTSQDRPGAHNPTSSAHGNLASDWIPLQPQNSVGLGLDFSTMRHATGKQMDPADQTETRGVKEPDAPFTIISSKTVGIDESFNSRDGMHKGSKPWKQTNNLLNYIDDEPRYLPPSNTEKSSAIPFDSITSLRETKPIYLGDSDGSNQSKASLTNLSKFEEILDRVRNLPYQQLEEQSKLAESYQTWRRENVEPLLNPTDIYHTDNVRSFQLPEKGTADPSEDNNRERETVEDSNRLSLRETVEPSANPLASSNRYYEKLDPRNRSLEPEFRETEPFDLYNREPDNLEKVPLSSRMESSRQSATPVTSHDRGRENFEYPSQLSSKDGAEPLKHSGTSYNLDYRNREHSGLLTERPVEQTGEPQTSYTQIFRKLEDYHRKLRDETADIVLNPRTPRNAGRQEINQADLTSQQYGESRIENAPLPILEGYLPEIPLPHEAEYDYTGTKFEQEAYRSRFKDDPYSSNESSRSQEPIIRVYRPTVSSRDEYFSLPSEESYQEIPGAYIMDRLMEDRLTDHAGDSSHDVSDDGAREVYDGRRFELGRREESSTDSYGPRGATVDQTTTTDESSSKDITISSTSQDNLPTNQRNNISNITELQEQFLDDYVIKFPDSAFSKSILSNFTTRTANELQSTGIRSDETVSELVRLGPFSSVSFPLEISAEVDKMAEPVESSVPTDSTGDRESSWTGADSSGISNILSSLTDSTGFDEVKNALKSMFAKFTNLSDETDNGGSSSTSYFRPRALSSSGPLSIEDTITGTQSTDDGPNYTDNSFGGAQSSGHSYDNQGSTDDKFGPQFSTNGSSVQQMTHLVGSDSNDGQSDRPPTSGGNVISPQSSDDDTSEPMVPDHGLPNDLSSGGQKESDDRLMRPPSADETSTGPQSSDNHFTTDPQSTGGSNCERQSTNDQQNTSIRAQSSSRQVFHRPLSDTDSSSTKNDSEGVFKVPTVPRFSSTRLAMERITSSPSQSLNSSVVSDLTDFNLSRLSNILFKDELGHSDTSWLFPSQRVGEGDDFRADRSPRQSSRTAEVEVVTEMSGSNLSEDGGQSMKDQETLASPIGESLGESSPILSWSDVLSQQQTTGVQQKDPSLARKEALIQKSKERAERVSKRKEDKRVSEDRKNKYTADGKFRRTDNKKVLKESNHKQTEVKKFGGSQTASKDNALKLKRTEEVKLSVKRGSKELAKQKVLQENRKRVKEFEKKIQKSLRNREAKKFQK